MDKLLITLIYASDPDISCVKITHMGGCQQLGPLWVLQILGAVI